MGKINTTRKGEDIPGQMKELNEWNLNSVTDAGISGEVSRKVVGGFFNQWLFVFAEPHKQQLLNIVDYQLVFQIVENILSTPIPNYTFASGQLQTCINRSSKALFHSFRTRGDVDDPNVLVERAAEMFINDLTPTQYTNFEPTLEYTPPLR